MTPSSSGFQRIGRERRAGRGDVDDQLGRAGGRRALGRPEALDDAIVGDAVLGEKAPGEIDVFGRDPHPLAAPGAIGGGDVLEIGHGAHVDPGLRRGDDDIGAAEAERRQQLEPRIGVGDLLAHQILAGDAEMGGAGGELADDLGGRKKGDLDAGQTGDGAAIVARAAPLHEFETGAGEKGRGVFLQPALRGDRQNEGRLWQPSPRRGSSARPPVRQAVERDRRADRGNVLPRPERRASPS